MIEYNSEVGDNRYPLAIIFDVTDVTCDINNININKEITANYVK